MESGMGGEGNGGDMKARDGGWRLQGGWARRRLSGREGFARSGGFVVVLLEPKALANRGNGASRRVFVDGLTRSVGWLAWLGGRA